MNLWSTALKRASGEEVAPVAEPDKRDTRFKDPDWTNHPTFDFITSALRASRGVLSAARSDEDFTQSDFRAVSRLLPFQNLDAVHVVVRRRIGE